MAKRLGIFFLLCSTALLAVTAYWLLFATYLPYDDEGYILLSLKNYSAHGGLYAQVFSQYGPFFYLLHDWGHRLLGYEFTNTSGRLITLGCWLVTAGASAHLVWRHTRSLALTGFTLGMTFFVLELMIHEPIHPGGVIGVLVAVGAWGGAWLINRRALPALAVGAGLLGATLLLTKINVGVFFLLSAGTWFAIQLHSLRQARAATAVSAGLLIILPVGLMAAELGEAWGQIFAGLSLVTSLTMVSAAWRERQPLTSWQHAGYGAGAGVLFGAAIVGAIFLRGTSLQQILEGVLLAPLRHPGIYHFAPNWRPGAAVAGGVSVILALLVWYGQAARLAWLIVGLRIILIAEICFAAVNWLPLTSHSSIMSYALPFAWIFVLRLAPERDPERPAVAAWVGLLLVLQYLHAYPVAGSQVAWGTFLIVPLMALGLQDTQEFLRARGRALAAPALGVGCLALAAISVGQLSVTGWRLYTESRPLQLPGAEDVRPPEDFARTLRLLALNATAHGDMLFTLPGLFSFNLWTDLPTPTLQNTTHWFSLLDAKQQEEISAALARSRRPVLIVNRGLINFLKKDHFSISGPLYDDLQQHYACAFKVRDYEFWVRQGQQIVPIGTAEFLELKHDRPGLAAFKLELVVAIPPGRKIARIELVNVGQEPLLHWDKSNAALSATGITLRGEVVTPEISSAWELALPPLVRLSVPMDQPVAIGRSTTLIYLRDTAGALLAEARFID